MFSKHIFILPFKWTCGENNDKQSSLEIWDNFEIKGSWKKTEFKIKNANDYNQYTYYYNFVRNAIFYGNNSEQIFHHYIYENANNSKYKIYLCSGKQFDLDIENITLDMFETGVGALTFHLNNNKCPSFDDILKINDFGRRIYPQFLMDNEGEKPTSSAKKAFLADKLIININGEEFEEDFSKFDDNSYEFVKNIGGSLSIDEKYLPNIFFELLGNSFSQKKEKDKIAIEPVIDDRMFTICWHQNDSKTDEFKKYYSETKEYDYETNPDWYKFIFVDNSYATCQEKNMIKKLNKLHTYERFTEWGTLYGLSRYSFVCLTNTGDFSENIISTHVTTMYYKMVLLCLMQRASILKFSERVTEISKKIKKQKNENNTDDILSEIENITGDYLKFVNTIYFREVTAQEQGIELYDKMQELMRIERDIKDLNREIDKLYQYAKFREDREQTKQDREQTAQINKLTILGSVLLIPTLITSFLGMNIFNFADKSLSLSRYEYLIFIVSLGLITYLSYCAFKFKKSNYKAFIIILTVILFVYTIVRWIGLINIKF